MKTFATKLTIGGKEGDWIVTTPVYVGTREGVAKAATCSHEWVEKIPEQLGKTPALDNCKYCIAVRARYSPVKEETES